MNELLIVSLTCPTIGSKVELQTRDWHTQVEGENKVIHYRADCSCGVEHFGFMTERFAVLHAAIVE